MADIALKDLDHLSCPICLDPLENPVTIPCGHNYCADCIEDYWNEDKHLESYSCPDCRETFAQRPALNENTMFAEVVEKLKWARLQDASPHNPGSANMDCRFCTGRKRRTVKFCSECVKSYCEAHTIRNDKADSGEKHIVVVINREPRTDICLCHNIPLEIYCRTDRQLICSLCFAESHRDHDAVSVAPISMERQEHKGSQHGNRHISHKPGRGKHKRSRHGSGHGGRHRSSSRKTLHLKSSHEVSHHESHGSNMIRNGHALGGGHMKSKHSRRHGSWHRSSRHDKSHQ